jgi:2Fe-2S ferredoxin
VPRVTFRSPLQELSVEVPEGTSILDAAEECGAQVGHSCGGACACSTCHVWVRKGYDSLAEQDDLEMDRLDQAFDVRANSRLACQAKVDGAELEVWITEESLKAFMDENPDVRRELEASGKWPPPK